MSKLMFATAAIFATLPIAFATADVEPVVVVKGPNGYPVRINKSEYNHDQHELHVADEHHDENGVPRNHPTALNNVGKAAAPQPSAPPPGMTAAPSTDAMTIAPLGDGSQKLTVGRQLGVLSSKGKFIIVDSGNGGTAITDDPRIDPKGYADNKSAWDVINIIGAAEKAAPAA